MVWLPEGENWKSFEDMFCQNVRKWQTYERTDTAWRHIGRACIASRDKNHCTFAVVHTGCGSRFTTTLMLNCCHFLQSVILAHQQSKLCQETSLTLYKHSDTSNTMKLVYWPLMDGLLHLVQQRGLGRAAACPGLSFCTKCNSLPIDGQCTNHRIAV